MSDKKNLPATKESLVPVKRENISQELADANPLLEAIVSKYQFYEEQDDKGNYVPEAVERNMLAEAKLSGDLYDVIRTLALPTTKKTALEELMTLTPRMEEFLGIDNGKNKTIELTGKRVSEGDNKRTEGRNKKTATKGKTTRKRRAISRTRRSKRGRARA